MSTQHWRERFRKEYSAAYKGILPIEMLEKGNPWFENFVSQVESEAYRRALEAVPEEKEYPIYTGRGGIAASCNDNKGFNDCRSQVLQSLQNLLEESKKQ